MCHLQSSRPWRSYPGGVQDAPAGSAHSASDAAHRRPDRLGHGLPGVTALRPPRPGNPQLSGGGGPGGQNRRLWHVPRHLQHRLLSGERLQKIRQECCYVLYRFCNYNVLLLSSSIDWPFAFMCPHLEISAAVFTGTTFHRNPKFVPLGKKKKITSLLWNDPLRPFSLVLAHNGQLKASQWRAKLISWNHRYGISLFVTARLFKNETTY